jgi:protein-disulfide isomerase
VPTSLRLSVLLLAASLTAFGCRAQTPAAATPAGKPIPPDIARRIEVLLRQKASLPPETTVHIGTRTPSEFKGFDTVTVSVSSEGSDSHPITFLLSDDGKTLAQLSKYDISADPRALISDAGRPSRGGPETAPVLIIGFDDLECPYCAKLHAEIFPALTQRYGDKVRIVYKDYPLPADMHPWAMRAAVDVNCMAAQSPTGYWNLVDYIHAHADEIGIPTGPGASKDKTLPNAEQQLDKLTRDQGAFQKVDATKLDACIAKQDKTAIEASQKIGEGFHVDSTPTLFINGDKIDGAVDLNFLEGIIDNALIAQGVTPPPPAPVAAAPKPSGK